MILCLRTTGALRAHIPGSFKLVSTIKPLRIPPSGALWRSVLCCQGRLAADARRADMTSKQSEIESTIANFRAGAAEALVEEQTKAAQLLARQDALGGKVRHADVRAPLHGTVSAVHVKTVGAVV
jgi:multidrug resistance efflux pump